MFLPAGVDEAIRLQRELAPLVVREPPAGFAPRTATGLDVAYDTDTSLLTAAAVTVELAGLTVVDSATATGETDFPYVSGLFAFRELPALLAALDRLATPPGLLVADGHGIAHPRRFGLASHLGVVTGLPAIGVAKTPPGDYLAPAEERGATSRLTENGEQVGVALRTRAGVKPVFVSVGHRMDLPTACRFVLALTPRYRLPETTRLADQLCRRALRDRVGRVRQSPGGLGLTDHREGREHLVEGIEDDGEVRLVQVADREPERVRAPTDLVRERSGHQQVTP